MTLEQVTSFLSAYPRPVKIMEVCGTHTSAIAKSGLRGLLSPNIKLVSGPGCPVCVTTASYIDALVELAFQKSTCVLCFGDLFKVNGSKLSPSQAKAEGASLHMIYSPLEAVELAKKNPSIRYIVAAVGFETTAPIYAILLEELTKQNISNVKIISALKTMPSALDWICENEVVDGFLCPGHVAVVIGSDAFEPICGRHKKPFVVAGFEAENIMLALYNILTQIDAGEAHVENLYRNVVRDKGNEKAQAAIKQYFAPADGVWRGIGKIEASALSVRGEYSDYAIEYAENGDEHVQSGCRCGDVILGRINPDECSLFQKTCRPDNPIGACMVSSEGACGIWFANLEGKNDD